MGPIHLCKASLEGLLPGFCFCCRSAVLFGTEGYAIEFESVKKCIGKVFIGRICLLHTRKERVRQSPAHKSQKKMALEVSPG